MTVRGLFVSGDGRLRAPWRIAIFLLAFVAILLLVALTLKAPLLAFEKWTGINETGDELAVTIAIIGAHVVMLRWLDRRPWSYVWMDRGVARRGLVGYGFLLGAVPITVASLSLLAMRWLSIETSPAGSWALSAVKVSAVLVPAALFEEMMSRGYILAALRDWIGMPAAVAISSVAFGLLHLTNDGATAQPTILVTLAGIFLAAVLLATKSLYAAWSAHFAWNWVMAVPLHVSVSGVPVPRPGYQTIDSGPDWATGGKWGPEGGAFAAVAILVAMMWMYSRYKKASNFTLQTSNAVP